MNQDEKILKNFPQNVLLEERKKLTVTGVSDVDSFDEQSIVVFTDMGELCIRGQDLHINKLSVDTGELSIEGNVFSLTYTDDGPRKESFFGKVFR